MIQAFFLLFEFESNLVSQNNCFLLWVREVASIFVAPIAAFTGVLRGLPVFAQKNIEFKFENKMPKNAKIKADQEMLRRVVDNLLSNAGKFTPTNGKILFTAEPYKNKRVLFSVEDSGAGVPKDKIEKIFDRYSQLDDRSKKGFGLGLAICRKIVELHNGKIWSESGECGVFRFFI